jgi:Anti-sigma-K factor rskA
MVRSDPPENWQDLAAGYALSNLSDEEVLSWEKLLNEHPELSEQLEDFQDAFDVFADVVPMHQPPDALLARIRATVQTQLGAVESPQLMPQVAPPAGVVTPSGDRRNQLYGLVGAIAAGAIVVLGLQIYGLSSELQQANANVQRLERDLQVARAQAQTIRPVLNTLQEPGTLVYSLHGSNLANSASGSLVMSDQKDVIILVKNLPELPDGKVYRLWADLSTATSLTYCGQFNTNTEGLIQLMPSSELCGQNPRQMVITVDAITDPTTTGGPVVMQGQT